METKSWLTDPVNGDGLAEFAEKIGLPAEYLAAARPVAEKIAELFPPEPAEFCSDLWDGDRIDAMAEKNGAYKDLNMLAAGILLGMRAHELYRSRGIGVEIYYPYMRELTVWS